MKTQSEVQLTAVALLEARLRDAQPSEIGALLDETWTSEGVGILVSTLLYLFAQVAADDLDQARRILDAHRWAFLTAEAESAPDYPDPIAD